MKIWEICKKENINKIYVDDKGEKWKVVQKGNKDIFDLYDNENDSISCYGYGISELVEMNFEEVIDWSKVSVDTKILVRDRKDEEWKRRYFAKYKDGRVYTWTWGKTSFSADGNEDVIYYEYAKLYKEGEE